MLMPIFDDLKNKQNLYYNVLANIIFCFRHKKHMLPPEVEKCPLVDEICNINTNNMAKVCCSVFSLIFSCCLF